ncbi:MAG: hypothetical protein WC532_00800 [Candidatus Omnitrophota bacterium]
MGKVKRLIAREGLIVLGLAAVLYLLIFLFLQNVPIALPQYRVEFANGAVYTVIIHPEIRNDSNYKRLLGEAHYPPPKLVAKRIKEFAKGSNIRSVVKRSSCINPNQVYISRLYSGLLAVNFILQLAVIYLIFLLIRFISWARKTQKVGGK